MKNLNETKFSSLYWNTAVSGCEAAWFGAVQIKRDGRTVLFPADANLGAVFCPPPRHRTLEDEAKHVSLLLKKSRNLAHNKDWNSRNLAHNKLLWKFWPVVFIEYLESIVQKMSFRISIM